MSILFNHLKTYRKDETKCIEQTFSRKTIMCYCLCVRNDGCLWVKCLTILYRLSFALVYGVSIFENNAEILVECLFVGEVKGELLYFTKPFKLLMYNCG